MGGHPREDGYTKALLIGFWAAVAVNILGQAVGVPAYAMITTPFLMLLLFCWAWQVLPRPRLKAGNYILIGILFAWLGDMLLMFASRDAQGNTYFLAGIGGFFMMQVMYIFAFLMIPGRHWVRETPLLVAPFLAYAVFMNLLLQPGRMRVPVILYSVVLVGMAVAALDLVPRFPSPSGWRVFAGSVLFVISDTFIALGAFGDLDLGNWEGTIVMATYALAQYLIVTGFVRALHKLQERADEPVPVDSSIPG